MEECDDILLQKFFETERWAQALEVGVDKRLNHGILREMCRPEVRAALYRSIKEGTYHILPPKSHLIPKDIKGEYRTVYINEDADRVLLHIANNLLMDLFPDMIHPSCKSYRKGTGCGRTVREVADFCAKQTDEVIGWKSDLSKYFDSVPIELIDRVFDTVEQKFRPSKLVRMIREYYHCDEYIDLQGNLSHSYLSLRQGCAVASFLANVILKDVDQKLSSLDGKYVRYSDDMIFIGPDQKKAMEIVSEEISKLGLSINPSKLQILKKGEWFSFLGFSICGAQISLSPRRIKSFQKEVEKRTIQQKGIDIQKATKRIQRFLYFGDGEFSWATQVLPYVNCQKDILTLNNFVIDCLRAVKTEKRRLGGLGFDRYGKDGCINRAVGRHVKANRVKTEKLLTSYATVSCMQNSIKISKEVYGALLRNISYSCAHSIGVAKRNIIGRR